LRLWRLSHGGDSGYGASGFSLGFSPWPVSAARVCARAFVAGAIIDWIAYEKAAPCVTTDATMSSDAAAAKAAPVARVTPVTYDKLTVIAIAALAGMLEDVLHEALGHGGMALLSGAHKLTVSTVALQGDFDTRWIAAAGPLVSLISGGIFWLLLLKPQRYRPATRYFFIMAMAGGLFSGTGYFLFSGVANFGDWAMVIQGWHPHWLWQVGLVAIGAPSYYGSMLLVAAKLRPFRRNDDDPRKMRTLCWLPYFSDGILAGIAGLFNPAGMFYVFASALASTLGGNAGMLSLPGMLRRLRASDEQPAGPLRRSPAWIAVGAIASLLFIFVLGRGITWTR
jgi:hypothetical protein